MFIRGNNIFLLEKNIPNLASLVQLIKDADCGEFVCHSHYKIEMIYFFPFLSFFFNYTSFGTNKDL